MRQTDLKDFLLSIATMDHILRPLNTVIVAAAIPRLASINPQAILTSKHAYKFEFIKWRTMQGAKRHDIHISDSPSESIGNFTTISFKNIGYK